jgi:hypothetical protein
MMIGPVDEREKIIKYWNGLRRTIQEGLWRDGYNPVISTWDDVRHAAEIIEIAEKVVQRNQSNQKPRERNGPSGNDSKNKRTESGNGGSQAHSNNNNYKNDNNNGNGNGHKRFQSRNGGHNNGSSGNTGGSSSKEKPKDGWKSSSNNRDGKSDKPRPPQLSDKEKADLISVGKCFNCKEPGHLARNCPKINTVKTGGRKPPGLTSFHIGFDLKEADTLYASIDDEVEVLESLPFGMLEFVPFVEEEQAFTSFGLEENNQFEEPEEPFIVPLLPEGESPRKILLRESAWEMSCESALNIFWINLNPILGMSWYLSLTQRVNNASVLRENLIPRIWSTITILGGRLKYLNHCFRISGSKWLNGTLDGSGKRCPVS